MSFFDKFFSHKSRNNKNENVLKIENEPLSFKTSHLNISKEHIRFILFRECDRRGRKLLFDSNAVEKLPLSSKGIMCNQRCQLQSSERIIDFIETTNTHGYKYKKPSSDVACLGEMIFGSVAMVYKGENSCKIHSIPSPKQLMFTTIVRAPSRCPLNTTSEISMDENSIGSSLASLNKIINQKETSSSDSKLYRREGVAQKYSSTYPWIKHNLPLAKKIQCCEISDLDSGLGKKSFLHKDSEIECLGNLCLGSNQSNCNLMQQGKTSFERLGGDGDLPSKNYLSQKNSDCEKDSACNLDSSVVTSLESDNVSSVSSSFSSLRRRWAQSYTTSLDSVTYEDTNSSPAKKRTKLGMALVLDLSNTFEDEMEKFLFNHTMVIDGIMCKLQSSVELAYIRNENFVDLVHTAFQESQQSIHELITGGKYQTPIWCTLVGNSDERWETPRKGLNDESMRGRKTQDMSDSVRLKFLNEFCDVLVKFDTKDTNFFISTLLTAVLTHHLSWVSSIAETDISASQQKLSAIKNQRPYNPLWAQLNDLCGLLGSPLKCAKTVITGGESKKFYMNTIIQILTYFIRCSNVVENVFDVDMEEVVGNADTEGKKFMENFDSDVESDGVCASAFVTRKHFRSKVTTGKEPENPRDEDQVDGEVVSKKENVLSLSGAKGTGLKRSKSYLSHMKLEDSSCPDKLYPDIKELAKRENVNVADLDYVENDPTVFVDKLLSSESFKENTDKITRVPEKSAKPQSEGYLSPDEGYDTIESTKTENTCGRKIQMERQGSAPDDRTQDIVFVLGDDEKLVNLQKKVFVNKSSVINLEKEDSKELMVDCDRINSIRCANASPNSENDNEKDGRTSEKSSDDTWNISGGETVKHSPNQGDDRRNACREMSWMIRELKMPSAAKPCRTRQLQVSSVLGGVNQQYNSEQVIQGVTEPRTQWEQTLRKDLFLCAHNAILEKDVNEALCIIGDMNSWEVSLLSSTTSILSRRKNSGIRVGMSQLVADMLESFVYLHTINLPPSFCLLHIERKLHEIYLKSKTVAELLNSTELCSIDYLTTRLDIGINDVPLLLSVATTHSPHISEKYGISFA